MFIAEPPSSPGELHFRLLGVPVRVHPFFWLVALVLGMSIKDGQLLLLWVFVEFASILAHEMGHVLAFARFGQKARVVLYAFGGLAIADRPAQGRGWGESWTPAGYGRDGGGDPDGWRQIFISFAGPLAGFMVAGLIVAGLFAANVSHRFHFSEAWFVDLGQGRPIENFRLYATVDFLLFVNILWGLINLLPIYPLDGGQIARELLLMIDARTGIRRSLVLSIGTGGIMAAAMILWQGGQGLFSALMFGFLAYSSFATLRAYDGGGFGGGYRDESDDFWRGR